MERETWYSEGDDDDGESDDVHNRPSTNNTNTSRGPFRDNLPREQEGRESRYHPLSQNNNNNNSMLSPKKTYTKNNSNNSSSSSGSGGGGGGGGGGSSGVKKQQHQPSIFDSIDSTVSGPPLARPKHQIPPRYYYNYTLLSCSLYFCR